MIKLFWSKFATEIVFSKRDHLYRILVYDCKMLKYMSQIAIILSHNSIISEHDIMTLCKEELQILD